MRIDAHQHFWRYDPAEYDWIDDSMWVLKRDFLPEDLEPHLRQHGLDGSVAVQARQSSAETDFLLELAAGWPFIRGVVGWVDFREPNVQAQLERLSEHTTLRGFRHIVQSEPDDRFLMAPDFLGGVRLLRDRGWTYDILIYPRQLPAAIEFARSLPDQKLVLDHIAKPAVAGGELEPWASLIRELARCPNVLCKVSGLVTEADWKTWKPGDFRPYLDLVFDSFGTERLMMGSDWPVCTLAGSYADVVAIVTDYIASLAPGEKEAILGRNAAEFYGLSS